MYRSHEENDLSTVSARKVTIAKAKVDLAEVEKKKAALAKMFPNTDIRVGSDATLDIPRISTGSIVVDSIIGGGLPAGRITEIFGPYSSGKTTFALTSIANVQKQGGSALFLDLESQGRGPDACRAAIRGLAGARPPGRCRFSQACRVWYR